MFGFPVFELFVRPPHTFTQRPHRNLKNLYEGCLRDLLVSLTIPDETDFLSFSIYYKYIMLLSSLLRRYVMPTRRTQVNIDTLHENIHIIRNSILTLKTKQKTL